ncbi:MAG TPA: DUF6658 family protein [Coleofasciculaceae cyanobacterium]
MNKVIDWLKSIRLGQILTVFMAGLLVFVSTACSDGASATTPDKAGNTANKVRQEVPDSAVTNKYEGGMNDYSDVDPRQSIKGAQSKAKGLVDNAQKNIEEKSIDSTEQYVENYRTGTPLGERVKRIGEDLGNAAGNVKEDLSKGSQKNIQGAKEAAQSGKQAANEATDAAQSKVKSDIRNTQQTLDKAANKSGNLGNKIKQAAQDGATTIEDTFD